jgi:hypothetical protein
MSLNNYQNYYHYCLQKYEDNNQKKSKESESYAKNHGKLNETKDLTQFQFDVPKYSPITGAIGYQLLAIDLHETLSKDATFDTTSFRACLETDWENIININSFAQSQLRMYNFNCNFELHRAYLFQNKPVVDDKADDINCDVYHWKNEPKTIITFYVNLNPHNKEPFMKVLYNPKYDKYITMTSNRHGEDEWGRNTHLRYKDCKLHDGQVQEFKAMGFIEKEVTGPIIALGNNVIHKHILEPNSNILVLKYRPVAEYKKTYKEEYDVIGNIFDYPVSPRPYSQ